MVHKDWQTKTHQQVEALEFRKYGWSQEEALSFSNFLIPMLDFDPVNRAKADQCLKHPFLEGV